MRVEVFETVKMYSTTVSIFIILFKNETVLMLLSYASCVEFYYLSVYLRLHSDTNIHCAS